MSTVKNKVQLTGHLGKAPEIRILESGKKMAKFSIATNDSYRNAGGEWITETQWHNIVAWGKGAEKAEELLDRGSEISLEGKLMNSTYVDKTGVKKYYTHVQAFGFEPVTKEEKAVV
jgi:single-strand DNA-binding protein